MKENGNKKSLKRKEQGITLIALVITIIVLLILAGVSIAMLTGDNGILSQAQRAKNETEKVQANETSDLANIESLINEYQNNIDIPQVTDENPGELEQEDANTLVINSIEDLVFFSNDVTKGNNYEGKTVKLGVNLDFNSDKSYVNPNSTDFDKYGYNEPLKQALTTGSGFSPIGNQERTNSFYGTFDGDNNVICSLYINMNSNENLVAGLFTENYGEIKNIGIVNTKTTVQGEINTIVGGLVAVNYNNIYNSYVTGSINVTGKGYVPVGGICGATKGSASIENCYNLANLECKNIKDTQYSANTTCGGIAGQASAENIDTTEVVNIQKCFNRGNINVYGNNTAVGIGGIISSAGNNNITLNIENCYNNAKIYGSTSSNQSRSIGGIIGSLNLGSVSNCYNVGDITGVKNGDKTTDIWLFRIGGIIGVQNNAEITNVFNVGKVIITNSTMDLIVGGIVGQANDKTTSKINKAYNIGSIEADGLSSSQVGSIAGNDSVTLSKCYYLKGTYDVGVGGSETSTGITELDSIDKFPSVLEVVNGEGAFEEDSSNVNNGYPVLKKD